MQQNTTESDLQSFLHSTGDQFDEEKQVIGAIVKSLLTERGRVTNKAIILSLIAELESTNDIEQLDVLRNCLEIVVGRTPDDDK
ncbi:biofilm/acid-resistance regulator YmgB/AriR [Pantoea sp. NPDC088449]|uniref:Biofilm development protein YmgB/AriR n=1 Tax=Candidatus Pantoea floridensis TaxID=1938870 RepID=A0A286DNP3_9GAMM|nr:biofilm/acid-resistance regulator YmgB/AriR [Pantoea floridensis]PIF15122.1 biofilm development protein YmgB/AriR [Enterobacteriaceae bacterium JKS000233]SOD60337.1 Biofilm development protein YmgB/AriR [Pantoea floridensis]